MPPGEREGDTDEERKDRFALGHERHAALELGLGIGDERALL
jgi:hypothetical protein